MPEAKEPPSIVKGIMARPVLTINSDSSVREAAEKMKEKGIGCVVVTKDDKPSGIATERDILQRVVAEGLDASEVKMEAIVSRPLITLDANVSIVDAIRIMQKRNVRHLPVTEGENLVGIVTQRDLLRALALHVLISFRPLL